MPNFIDLTGKKFGKLTVIKRVPNSKWNEVQLLCNCICGSEPIIKSGALKRKKRQGSGQPEWVCSKWGTLYVSLYKTNSAKFADFLIARGQTVELHDLPAPQQQWTMPIDLMATSFQMEVDVTTSLQQLYAFAERSSDTRTTVFLDPMIEKQTQSEHEFAHLLGRVRFADNQASALLLIDNELELGKFQPASMQTNPVWYSNQSR